MTPEDREALDALLADPRRLWPEERRAIVGLIGRVERLDVAEGGGDAGAGFPVLPRAGFCTVPGCTSCGKL